MNRKGPKVDPKFQKAVSFYHLTKNSHTNHVRLKNFVKKSAISQSLAQSPAAFFGDKKRSSSSVSGVGGIYKIHLPAVVWQHQQLVSSAVVARCLSFRPLGLAYVKPRAAVVNDPRARAAALAATTN